MHFTVVFDSHEPHDLSYGLAFKPCAVWIEGEREIATPLREYRGYKPGYLTTLLKKEQIEQRLATDSRAAILVVHEDGHGSDDDLRSLRDDLTSAGFAVTEVRAATAHGTARTIDELRRIEQSLASSQLARSEREWGGAGVIITASSRADDSGAGGSRDILVLTEHSLELSWCFEQLRDAFCSEDRLDYSSKYAFFGRLAEAANRCLRAHPQASANELCSAVVQEAFAIYDEMERGAFA